MRDLADRAVWDRARDRGPSTDEHPGGTPGEDPKWRRFHRVKGGFLSGVVRTRGNASTLEFRFHDVRGEVVYRQAPAR